jgi:nucleoid DNA-binding protein
MGRLTIQDIAAVLVKKNGIDKREAGKFVSTMFTLIQERLESEQIVKVKGLGTFKLVGVEARESVSVRTGERFVISGHSKITFTPDATMKELVNKPFSQFETVILNDGVEFEDMKVEVESEEEEQQPVVEEEQQPVVEEEQQPVVEEGQQPVVEEEQQPVVEAVISPLVEQPVVEEEQQPVVEEEQQPVVETEQPVVEVEEPADDTEDSGQETEPVDEETEEEERPWGRWLLCGLGVLALMALSAFGGYYYGSRQQILPVIEPDTIVVHDTIAVAPSDTVPVKTDTVEQPEQPAETKTVEQPEKVDKPVVEQPAQPKPVETKPVVTKPAEPAVDKYAAKDDRVRLGAYRIVGLETEVKVQPGQTFRSICKAYLGPDMECYVEVFNDLPKNPTVKVGQVIKIPKVQVKKKTVKKTN